MKTVTYNHNPAAFKVYSQFKNDQDFNTNMEKWLADHKTTFGRKELEAIKTLFRHAVKVPGIATLKIKTLVSVAAQKFNFIFTDKTAKRAIAKAKEIGMLKTLKTKSAKTGLKAPSIYVWQKYKNVPTLEQRENVKLNVSTHVKSDNSNVQEDACQHTNENQKKRKMSPHKAVKIKSNIINYYIRKGAKDFKSIAVKMTVKKIEAPTKLLTQPVKPKESFKPLRFISRLKDVVYRSLVNTKEDVKAFIEIVHANVYALTKFDMYKPYTDTLLEKALRIVDACLNAHKNGELNHIKSMRGFIDSRIKAELQAITADSVAQVVKELNTVCPETSKAVVDLYTEALEEARTPAYLKGPFYDWRKD